MHRWTGISFRPLYGPALLAVAAAMSIGAPTAGAAGVEAPWLHHAPSVTGPAPTYSLSSGAAQLTSSTNQKLLVGVNANSQSGQESGSGASLQVFLTQWSTVGTSGSGINVLAGQDESYGFNNLKSSDFTIAGSGKTVTKATVNVGMGDWGTHFGMLFLTFTPSSFTDAKCKNASQGNFQRTYTGTMHGKFVFDTTQGGVERKYSRWGSVTANNITFNASFGGTASKSTLVVSNGCDMGFPKPPPSYCFRSLIAAPTSTNTPDAAGLKATDSIGAYSSTTGAQTFSDVYADREVMLTGLPKGQGNVPETGERSDSTFEYENKFPVTGGPTNTSTQPPLKVTIGPAASNDKLFSGSATVSVPKSGKNSTPCTLSKSNPKKGSEISYSNYIFNGTKVTTVPTTWTNGPAKLTAHAAVGGNITIPNGTAKGTNDNYGYIGYSTYK